MSETKNLRLFKHNEPLETNENKFDIDLALNQNWDKIEEFAGMVNDKVIELEDKDEEQDFNLQELQNEIKKDRENMINLEVEGQSIHIEDSSDLEGKLEVLGNVEQDVREGKNLYNAGKTIDDYFVTSGAKGNVITQYKAKDYVICKIDKGVMTIEKYNNSGYNWITKWIEIEKNTEYTISLDKSLTSVSVLGFSTKENKMEGVIIAELNASKKEVNFNSGDYAFYAVSFYPKQGLEIAIQVEEGKQKTEFEQYGASPSPEYPSEIKAVGDNINLFNKEQVVQGSANSKTAMNRNSIFLKKVKKGEKYTSQIFNSNLNYAIAITDTNTQADTIKISQDSGWLTGNYTINCESDGYLYMGIRKKDNANINPSEIKATDFKVEKGEIPTSYSKFGQGSVEIKKQNKNLFDKNNIFTKGNHQLSKENGEIIEAGGPEWVCLESYVKIKENCDYMLSGELLKSNWTINIWFYDANKIGINIFEKQNNGLNVYKFTTPKNAKYIRFVANSSILNASTIQLEEGDTKTEYIEHQEETKILPIQKPMLKGDHFNRTDNKEVHTWKKIMLDGVNNKVTQETTATNGKYRYKYTDKDLKNCSLSEEKAYCTHLQLIEKNKTYDKIVGFTVSNGSLLIYTDGDTAVNFNAKLQKENYIFYIPVIESAYKKIDLTLEQTKVLDELDNFPTYKPVTNITTDSIAKLKLKYIADTKTYIDNKTSNLEQQVNTINQLLSTTKTSAKLLDNLQSDIESEVL